MMNRSPHYTKKGPGRRHVEGKPGRVLLRMRHGWPMRTPVGRRRLGERGRLRMERDVLTLRLHRHEPRHEKRPVSSKRANVAGNRQTAAGEDGGGMSG